MPMRSSTMPHTTIRAIRAPQRRRSGWLLSSLLSLALIPLLLSACDSGLGTDTTGGSSSGAATPCTGSNCTPGKGAQGVQVFVEPDAKAQPVLNAIKGATKSVWVEVRSG